MKTTDYRNLTMLLRNSGINFTTITIEDTRALLNKHGFNL